MTRYGIDLFSLRSQGWSAFEYLQYCASQGVQGVHFSEPRFLGSLDEDNLRQVREEAERLGIGIEIGMLSICPASKLFDATKGTAEEQLTRMIRAAQVVGSPILRAVLGNRFDRHCGVPMQEYIESTVRVLRGVRSVALDAGIRIAIENHGGDLRACELRELVEAAGTDFVGVCLDSGNLPLTFDLPCDALDLLAPYVVTTHIRDARIFSTETGVAVAWVRAGEGNIGLEPFLRRLVKLKPECPLQLETIVLEPRTLDFRVPGFWDAFPELPQEVFQRYMEVAERGTPPAAAAGVAAHAIDRERSDSEASLRYCREILCSQESA
jgi:sugar phosphate isomerase/epimerase